MGNYKTGGEVWRTLSSIAFACSETQQKTESICRSGKGQRRLFGKRADNEVTTSARSQCPDNVLPGMGGGEFQHPWRVTSIPGGMRGKETRSGPMSRPGVFALLRTMD